MITSNYVRPMKFSELIAATFSIYKEIFFSMLFINIPSLIAWPFITLIFLSAISSILQFFQQNAASDFSRFTGNVIGVCCISIIFLAPFYSPILATVIGTSNGVLKRPISVPEIYRRVFSKELRDRFIVGVILLCILLLIGYTFVIIPGVIISIFTIFVFHSMALEKKKGLDAFTRSFELAWNALGKVLLVVCIFILPCYALMLLGSWLCIPVILIAPLPNIMITLLYYDTRARKEKYNEQILAEEMGYQPIGEMINI